MPRPPSPASLLGLLALAALGHPAAAFTPDEAKMPMTVTLVRSDAASCSVDCPEWLALTGKIGPDTPALFSAALKRLGRREVPVLVDSPGGSVEAAMAIGRAVRARKMTVAVAGTALTDCAPSDGACAARRRTGERPGFVAGGLAACASACVLILAAGADRSVGEHSYVGVHQMVAHRTMTRVMNYFRIVRRMVNGRPVEVSRTLVGTKPISSTTTTVLAPETMYSEVDRYLLGLGIAESIMPLMRSAPPSGIHWMTPAELAATRIATDTTDASTLVARAAEPEAPSGAGKATAMALAAAQFGDGPQASGIVDWRVTRAGGDPVLVGTVDVPERHLHGTVALRRDAAPGGPGGFVATVDFGLPAAIEPGRLWMGEAPTVCGGTDCLPFFTPAVEADDGQGKRQFRVRAAWGDSFLLRLEDRLRLVIPLSSDGAAKGWVSLSVKDGARAAVAAWERLCCAVGGDGQPVAAPTADEPVVSWTAQPDGRSLRGTVDLRGAGLRLTLEAGPISHGVGLVLDAAVDPDRFGPLTDVDVAPIRGAGGQPAVTAGARRQRPGVFEVDLAADGPVPAGARLDLVLVDARGRRLPVAIPLPKVLTDSIAAQPRPRADPAGTSRGSMLRELGQLGRAEVWDGARPKRTAVGRTHLIV